MKEALFFPDRKKKLVDAYPELATKPEFRDLTKPEGDFVWWFACQASPLNSKETGIKDRFEKARAAFDNSFGPNADQSVRVKYYNCQFSPEIMQANEVMQRFSPDHRSRANEAEEQIFKNLLSISKIDINNVMYKTVDGVEVFDASSVSSYVTAIQKVREELPEVIKIREEGFGINAAVSVDLASGKTAHEIALERRSKTSER